MDNNINVQIPEEQKYVQEPVQPKKKKSKLPIIIIILIILVGVGFSCWYFFLNNDNKKEETKKEEKEEPQVETKENKNIKNALEEYNNLPKNGFKFTLYCDEYGCDPEKPSSLEGVKVINQSCVGKTLNECYPGKRDENQDTDKVDGHYNYNVITDSGYIILNNEEFAYRCINNDCLYINHEQGKLFVYDGKIYIIDIKNETRTELDLTFKDIFEGQKAEDFYDDGHISFVITGEKKEGNSVVNVYSDHLLEYTSSDGGQASDTYFYDLNTNKKTKKSYSEYNYIELNGKKYILGSSVYSEPGYAGIVDADTLEEVKSYNDANTIILNEKNKQILVAVYKGEGKTFNDTYKVVHKLDYNLNEIK